MPIKVINTILMAFLCLSSIGCSITTSKPQQAAVSTAHPLATQAAFRVLDKGGNAFDAAVAAAAMLAVVEPYGSGLGGGGFWLLNKRNGDAIVIDARERAPLKASRDMYLDESGQPLASKPSINGALAAGIPGHVAAFGHVSKHYGIMPLSKVLQDSIQVAENGFRVTKKYQKMAGFRQKELRKHAGSNNLFLNNGELPAHRSYLKQPKLALTLRRIARYGSKDFYTGELARNLVQDVQKAGGIWSLKDLSEYRIVEREPIKFRFKDYQVLTAPPPSSGGIALSQMLGMYDRIPERKTPLSETQLIAQNTEIMRLAYKDRAQYLGDPDFVEVPTEDLIHFRYLGELARSVYQKVNALNASQQPPKPVGHIPDNRHTTHFSIVDGYGNKASVTLSINLPFGSGVTSAQTGILLNNEMDDFSIKPGHPNAYGLVGNEANAIAPGKRPLSSMTPTIIENDKELLVTGTPGGSRIISMVYQSVIAFTEGKTANEIVSLPRYHHQYKPDIIQHEPNTFTQEQISELKDFGYQTKDVGRQYGNMQIVTVDKGDDIIDAASDPRGIGQAISQQRLE